MKTLTSRRDKKDDTDAVDLPPIPDSDGEMGIPRWVYVLGIIALVLVLSFVIMHFTFGGFGGHGVQRP